MIKDTVKQAAAQLFASTAHQVLWANPKGEFFTSENIGALSLKSGQKLIKFERQEEKETTETTTSEKKELSANDAIAKIKAVTSLEALKEFEGDERKSVKSVYTWMKKQLTAQIPVVGAKTETGATQGAAGSGNGNEGTGDQK